jgi:PglZ domain
VSKLAQIRAQVETIYKKSSHARAIGIKTGTRWQGDEKQNIGGQEFRFVQCDSSLQARELLIEAENSPTPIVLISDLNDIDLGLDAVARLAKGKLFAVRPWPIVLDLFQARDIDPALLAMRWLADALLDIAPSEGYPPAPSGILDEETVWGFFLRHRLRLDRPCPDARDILEWSLEAENLARYLDAPKELREGIRCWVERWAGPVGDLIFGCIESGHGKDAVAVGLACFVLAKAFDVSEVKEAAVRLERMTGNKRIIEEHARVWAEASGNLIEKMLARDSENEEMRALVRSDEILKEGRVERLAYLSPWSPVGFELRLARYGAALQTSVDSGLEGFPPDIEGLAEEVIEHQLAERYEERVARVQMSLRLLRWLKARKEHLGDSLPGAAQAYLRDGGFVDWARNRLLGGEGIETLAKAYASLVEVATSRRERENKTFAELLVGWSDTGSTGEGVIAIEDVLKSVVAPASQANPVLVIVADGMGVAVFRELMDDITSQGWIQLVSSGWSQPKPVIAALPSVTEISRASLLCGKLTKGASPDEAQGFANNNELLAASRAGFPPVLFHKATLTDVGGSDLTTEIRAEIASDKRRVVGVVVNAIDDHLAKGEQVLVPWRLRHLPVLEQLLYAARDSGRVVILTSDHGHIIERQTTLRRAAEGERYRADDDAPLGDELIVAGARVLTPNGRLIAPWSESVRYAGKKHGYHGGLTPQECVVPLAVLSRFDQSMAGWSEVPAFTPEWWYASDVETECPAPEPRQKTSSERPTKSKGHLPLFDDPVSPITGSAADWIENLMKSDAFATQSKLAGRAAPSPELVRSFLATISERGGTMLKGALAQRLGQPEIRVHGIIATMRRVLNVDGYAVLAADETSDSVTLDLKLLRVQFELKQE